MADRKQTPDILGEILGDMAAAPPAQPGAAPVAELPGTRPGAARKPRAARKPAAQSNDQPAPQPRPQETARPAKWEYVIISFQEHNGWRPRFINGQELEDWTNMPVIHDYANLLGEAGWELAGAGSGALYGLMDSRQLCFKREKPAA